MTKNPDDAPHETESVKELDIKQALHTLVLYLGELDELRLDSTVGIPDNEGGQYKVDVSVEIGNVRHEK